MENRNKQVENIDWCEEHKLYYNIYYNEVTLFYQKTTIFTTIQLGLFTGIILKYDEIAKVPWIMAACLCFLVCFSIVQLLVSIRGNNVNNAVIETISTFERDKGFDFLEQFNSNVRKGFRISQMNYPSMMIIAINILFLGVWMVIAFHFYSTSALMVDITKIVEIKYVKYVVLAVVSCLFAITMKIADLLDEHGLKWFRHADILFGVLWGFFGIILVLADLVVANIIMAMMIGFVIRKRLDYLNHIIAFTMITAAFFMWSQIDVYIYFPFLLVIVTLGLIKDLKYKNSKSKFSLFIEKVYLYVPLIYAFPSLIYCCFYGNWSVFIVFFMYDFTYNVTRIISKKMKWYKDIVEL